MTACYRERFGSPEHLPPVPDSPEEFAAMTTRPADLTVHDEQIVKMRKLLTPEQFRDGRARELATKHLLTGQMEKFTHILAGMMDKELIRRDDPVMPAFACTAPASVLIHPCDRERPKTEEAARKIEAFSRHFAAAYGKE